MKYVVIYLFSLFLLVNTTYANVEYKKFCEEQNGIYNYTSTTTGRYDCVSKDYVYTFGKLERLNYIVSKSKVDKKKIGKATIIVLFLNNNKEVESLLKECSNVESDKVYYVIKGKTYFCK